MPRGFTMTVLRSVARHIPPSSPCGKTTIYCTLDRDGGHGGGGVTLAYVAG